MHLTLQGKLTVTSEQRAALVRTVERMNEACDWLAGRAFDVRCANKFELQKRHYAETRSRFGLSAARG